MRLADLSAETRERIARLRFDRIVEKHEGPWDWRFQIEKDRVEFLTVEGRDLLLPVPKGNHPNISIIRFIPSADSRTVTLFLTDTTYYTGIFSGFLAICEQVPGEQWYLALVYHEWFVIDDVPAQYQSLSS